MTNQSPHRYSMPPSTSSATDNEDVHRMDRSDGRNRPHHQNNRPQSAKMHPKNTKQTAGNTFQSIMANKKGATLSILIAVGIYICMILWGLQLAGQSGRYQHNCALTGSVTSSDGISGAPLQLGHAPPIVEFNSHNAPPTLLATAPSTLPYQMTDFDDTASLTILPNELPGYTGWARPIHTLVDYFEIVNVEPPLATVGQNWTVTVHCQHEAAKQGGSLFYIRAFGRALLPGTVVDHKNGKYTITILPHDAGTYTLEVVLTVSQTPDFKDTPLPGKLGEPSYEGFLLPGFPMTFRAVETPAESKADVLKDKRTLRSAVNTNNKNTKKKRQNHPLCTAKQLTETSPISPLETGRWLVVNKTRHFPISRAGAQVESYHQVEQINIDNYKNSANALGIQMEYFYNDCDVLSYKDMTSKDKWLEVLDSSRLGKGDKKKQAIHVLYVGDSNTRNQFNYFRDHIGKQLGRAYIYLNGHSYSYLDGRLKLTYIDMMGNWPETFNKTRYQIKDLTTDPKNKGDNFSVLFNAGLHEITNRCSLMGAAKGLQSDGSCHDVYMNDVRELTEVIKSFPASLRVWQSSVAGWPKWGVFGISWPQAQGQKFPREPNFCAYINDLAWDIMQKENIPTMDTYWMTLSRPDHREVVQKETIRTMYKLVHLGDEVYTFLVRKFVHMIFEAREQGKTGVQYL